MADDAGAVVVGVEPLLLPEPAGVVVAVVEPTGSETHVVIRAAGRELTAVFRDRVSLRPGDAAVLAPVDAGSVHLFDKTSGMRF